MHVLVLGNRQGLNKALEKLNVSYTLLVNQPIKFPPKRAQVIQVKKFPLKKSELEDISKNLNDLNINPTHVIATIEAAVLAASFLRRHLDCRLSVHSVIKKCALKSEMKSYLQKFEIPMTPFILSHDFKNNHELISLLKSEIGFPIVAKEINNSGGRGIQIIRSEKDLETINNRNLIFEKFIEGSEGSIESFIQGGKILFTNITEYFDKKYSNILPANFDNETTQRILELNKKVIESLKISWGMTHMEFYLSKSGLLFGEIALRPPGGYIMRLLKEAYDFDPWLAFASIELDLAFDFPTESKAYAGCLIYHPGEGEVQQIKEVTASSHIQSKIKIDIGHKIKPREGVGEDVGYSIFSHSNQKQIKKDIQTIKDNNPIEIKN